MSKSTYHYSPALIYYRESKMNLIVKIFSFIFAVAPEDPDKLALLEKEKEEKLKKHGVTCNKCAGLAIPIEGTHRNYRCSCGRQFPGVPHPF